MKGLLIKDFYQIKESLTGIFWLLLIIGLAGSVGFIRIDSPAGAIDIVWLLAVFTPILAGLVVLNLIVLDKSARWDKLAATFPISRREIVLARYVFNLLVVKSILVAAVIISGLLSYVGNGFRFDLDSLLVYSVMGFFFSIAFTAFALPGFILKEAAQAPGSLMGAAVKTMILYFGLTTLIRHFICPDGFALIGGSLLLAASICYLFTGWNTARRYNRKNIT